MTSTSAPTWRRLPLTRDDRSSDLVLFFKYSKYDTGINCEITDLVHIWTADKTSTEEMKEEAARTRCSIDPSDDEEQYNVFVSKLEEAVLGQNGGNVSIRSNRPPSASASFEVDVAMPLAAPLGTLKWTFKMLRQDSVVLTQELLIPCLCLMERGRKREEDLQRKLREKDHVIGKLMDKMEGSGIDFSMVFPGFAGARKGLNAKQAARAVPGIGAFNERAWEENFREGQDDRGVQGIVNDLKDEKTGELAWEALSLRMVKQNGGTNPASKEKSPEYGWGDKKDPYARSSQNDHEESDFSDAPRQRRQPPKRSTSSTASPLSRHRGLGSKRQSNKLGTLEGRNEIASPVPRKPLPSSSSSPPPELTAKSSKKRSANPQDSSTESELELHSRNHKPDLTPHSSPRKPPSKLGVIGGRKAQSQSEPQAPEISKESPARSKTSPSSQINRKSSQTTVAKPKLGAIGGKKVKATPLLQPIEPPKGKNDNDDSSTGSPSPTPSITPERASVEPRAGTEGAGTKQDRTTSLEREAEAKEEAMTEEERANWKRAELKRAIDAGARGLGAKKRRF